MQASDAVERGLFKVVRDALASCYAVRASRPSYMASKLDEQAHAVIAAMQAVIPERNDHASE